MIGQTENTVVGPEGTIAHFFPMKRPLPYPPYISRFTLKYMSKPGACLMDSRQPSVLIHPTVTLMMMMTMHVY